jgi:hexosaminidase
MPVPAAQVIPGQAVRPVRPSGQKRWGIARLSWAWGLGLGLLPAAVVTLGSCKPNEPPPVPKTAMESLIPRPVSVVPSGSRFVLDPGAQITVEPATPELLRVAGHLAERLRPATGYALPIGGPAAKPAPAGIRLTIVGEDPSLGEEGYLLAVNPEGVRLAAYKPAGLFRGIQTIRQLLPARIESTTRQPGPWEMEGGSIRDLPRFEWRGVMLDVARSFFTVEDVKRYMDQAAAYKLNRFHLHLSDDQGWRIEIKSWPALAMQGGKTAITGGNQGYFSQAEYSELVAYAQERYLMVVPEIDMPGHTNAALSAYPELSPTGVAPTPYSGMEVGFSSLAIDKEVTYRFVTDVVRELAAITPGPFIHIGGDEASKTSDEDYRRFVTRALEIVRSQGKQAIGWGEVARADQVKDALIQHWIYTDSGLAQTAVKKGARIIMSPASRAYLDMKYTRSTRLGQDWAALIEVKDAYDWDPASFVSGVTEDQIVGVEAALWSETLKTPDDLDFMTYPRLQGLAEIGWSTAAGRTWIDYRDRLRNHGARMAFAGVNFYQSPQVPWP